MVAARERHLTVLLVAVWGRIGRMRTRLERLIARWRAEMLPAPRKSRAGELRVSVRAPSIIPRTPAWLLVAVRGAGAVRGSQTAAFRPGGAGRNLQSHCVGLRFLLSRPQPDQRRGPSVAGYQAQNQRRLVVMGEVGPVHRHQDIGPRADLLRNLTGEAVPHVYARVAHQTINLLDRMLGYQTTRLR